MQILAFNGSPRKEGNTSTIIGAILEGRNSKDKRSREYSFPSISPRKDAWDA